VRYTSNWIVTTQDYHRSSLKQFCRCSLGKKLKGKFVESVELTSAYYSSILSTMMVSHRLAHTLRFSGNSRIKITPPPP